jgi:hypothetical protein
MWCSLSRWFLDFLLCSTERGVPFEFFGVRSFVVVEARREDRETVAPLPEAQYRRKKNIESIGQLLTGLGTATDGSKHFKTNASRPQMICCVVEEECLD